MWVCLRSLLAVLGTKIESFFGGRLSPTVFPDPVILVIMQFAPTSRGLSVSVIDNDCVFGIRLNSTQRAMFVRQTRLKSHKTLLYATKKHPAFGLLRPPEVYPS